MLNRETQLPELAISVGGTSGIWAPTLRLRDGTWYLLTTMVHDKKPPDDPTRWRNVRYYPRFWACFNHAANKPSYRRSYSLQTTSGMKVAGVMPYISTSKDTIQVRSGTRMELHTWWGATHTEWSMLPVSFDTIGSCVDASRPGNHIAKVNLTTGAVQNNWTNLWSGTGGLVSTSLWERY